MSKHELRRLVLENSGVSYEESQSAITIEPSLFERLGTEGFRQLSSLFYDRVFDDGSVAPWFLSIFSSSTKEDAIENQYKFLVQTFGGPDLYRQAKGKYTRLVGRHAAYPITHDAAHRWVHHMSDAMQDHYTLRHDTEARKALNKYFSFTAHYIVIASEFMRPDQVGTIFDAVCWMRLTLNESPMQLSGGTEVDSDKIW